MEIVEPVREYLQDFETSGEGSVFDFGTGRNALAALAMGGVGSVPGAALGGLMGVAPGLLMAPTGGFLGGVAGLGAGAIGGSIAGGLGGAALGGASGAAAGAALGALGGPAGVVVGGMLGGLAGGVLGGGLGALGGEVVGAVGGAAAGTVAGTVGGFAAPVLGGAAIGGLASGLGTSILGEAAMLSMFGEGQDARFVSNDGGGDTGLWSFVTGEERGPDTLGEMAGEVADLGQIEDFEISGHGYPGAQTYGDETDRIQHPALMSPEDLDAMQDIAGHMTPDGEVVLGGCDVAKTDSGIDAMQALADRLGHPVTGGVSTQLPFPGIEGTQVTVYPGRDEPVVDQSFLDPLYDAGAPMINSALGWLYGTMG